MSRRWPTVVATAVAMAALAALAPPTFAAPGTAPNPSPTSPEEPRAAGRLEGRGPTQESPRPAAPIPAPSPAATRLADLPQATFVVGAPESGTTPVRIHPEVAAERVPPCSTFKIPNALLALETGAITLEESRIPRDREAVPAQPWWPKNWDRDSHDLASALQGSVVWYFQELARRIGEATMQRRLDGLGYGDRDLSGGLDRFWLSSTLDISADEQVAFLGRLWRGETGFAPQHVAFVRDALTIELGDGWRWFGKTGSCTLVPPSGTGANGRYELPEEERWTLWLVGWVEGEAVPGGARTYAFRVETGSYEEGNRLREERVRPLLVDAGVIPQAGVVPEAGER